MDPFLPDSSPFFRKRYEDAVKKQKKKQQEDEMKKPVTANRS